LSKPLPNTPKSFLCAALRYPVDGPEAKSYRHGEGGVGGHTIDLHSVDHGEQEKDPLFIARAHLEIHEVIGEGSFGEVRRAVFKQHQDCAVKFVKLGKKSSERKAQLKAFRGELDILQKIRSPHVVQVLGWNFVDAKPFFVTERMTHGSLWDCIGNKPDEYAWGKWGKTMAIHSAIGLCYLHTMSPPVVHFDIKTDNILVTSGPTAKLGDVGIAKQLSRTRTVQDRGSVGYTAPEIFNHSKGNDKSDVFSFGVVLIAIITQEEPRKGSGTSAPSDCDPALKQLITECIDRSPDKRPTILNVLSRLKNLT
jgi:serine/threonine protein kinase